MNRPSDGSKPIVPNGPEEIDLQINTGEALPICNSREMSCTNRRIGDVTQDSTMNGSHGIRMELRLSFHLKRSCAFTDFNESKPQSLHDGKREIERRLVSWADCATQNVSQIIEIADSRRRTVHSASKILFGYYATPVRSRYPQTVPHDVAGVIGCEKHHGLRNLIGCAESAEQNTVGNHVLLRKPAVCGHDEGSFRYQPSSSR